MCCCLLFIPLLLPPLPLLPQADAVHWGPSLVFLPAFGLLAGRSIKVLTTIKSHQAALTSTMLSMAYTAARDSQEGVICKLVDELRDADTKEAALALTVMLTGCWEREGTGAGGNGGRGHGSSSSRAFSIAEVDAACEAFLERHFGLQVGASVCWCAKCRLGKEKESSLSAAASRLVCGGVSGCGVRLSATPCLLFVCMQAHEAFVGVAALCLYASQTAAG